MGNLASTDKVVTAEMLQAYHDEHVAPFLGGNVLGAQSRFKQSDIYSTSERIVGCWTDGRPLYQVLVPIATGAVNTWHEESISTSIIPTTAVFRTVHAYIESTGGQLFNINNECGNNNGCGFYLCKVSATNQAHYGVYPNYNDFVNRTGYMVIQYTKTTDAAGSYYLAGENDYSTDEKIIGTWIDGKPIYRKTLTYSLSTNPGTGGQVFLPFSDYGLTGAKIKSLSGYAEMTDGSTGSPLDSHPSWGNIWYDYSNSRLVIYYANGFSDVPTNIYITLEYTKS